MTILPPGVAHDGRPAPGAGGFRKRELYLDDEFLPVALTGAAVDHTRILDPPLRAALARLHDGLLLDRAGGGENLQGEARLALIGERITGHLISAPLPAARPEPDIARQLRELLKGARPAEVATTVGFYDQAHFTRHFKKHTSTTPASYARGHVRQK